MSRAERLALVEWIPVDTAAELPLSVQAELLSLSRSSLYYQPVLPSAQEVAIKHRIDEVYTACPFYGSRRITAQLVRDGMTINRKTVQRHMREMGIAGVAPGPNLSQRRKEGTEEAEFDPASLTVAQIRELAGQLSKEEWAELLTIETANKNRSSAVAFIRSQIDAGEGVRT